MITHQDTIFFLQNKALVIMINRDFYLDKYEVSQVKKSYDYQQFISILFLLSLNNVIATVNVYSLTERKKLGSLINEIW
jgi:hypothetical protein